MVGSGVSPRVVLVSAPVSVIERYGDFSGAASTHSSFGLACLAGVARHLGAEVRVIDASAENLSLDEAFHDIVALAPDIVGITSTTSGVIAAGELCQRIKDYDSGIVTILGGCHVTALPKETLLDFSAIDVAVLGEGELTFAELLNGLLAGDGIRDDLEGTAIISNGGVRINNRRPTIPDMDALPLPAWSLIRGFPRRFKPSPSRVRRFPSASLVLTRGCPNKCVFCDRSVFGNKCRSYSPSYAIRMLQDLRKNYGVKEVLIEDDTFVLVRKWVREFCLRLIETKIDITWSCLGRADQVTPDLLKLMRKAGCWHISFGIESGDPEILWAMGKNLSLDEIERAVRWSHEAGLQTKGFFMIGFPGESQRSLAATRELAKRLPLDDISVMQLTPFPGSELFRMADKEGTFERNWQKMNTLNTVFVPTGFSKADLERERSRVLREFYFRPRVLLRKVSQVIGNPRTILEAARAFRTLLRVVKGAA